MNGATGHSKPECAEEHLHGGGVTVGSSLRVWGAAEKAEHGGTTTSSIPSASWGTCPYRDWVLVARGWALAPGQNCALGQTQEPESSFQHCWAPGSSQTPGKACPCCQPRSPSALPLDCPDHGRPSRKTSAAPTPQPKEISATRGLKCKIRESWKRLEETWLSVYVYAGQGRLSQQCQQGQDHQRKHQVLTT